MMNAADTASEQSSAVPIASHMPSLPISSGRISSAASWNTSVRKNEIAADTGPLLSAVKNDDAKILNPHSRNCSE